MSKPTQTADKAGASLDFHPLYLQIKERLIARVLRGDWRPGEILPSEFKLAAEFNVSQGTVRKALDELAAEKAVIRMQGKGTFVAARATRDTPLHFFRIVLDGGLHWAPHNTKVLTLGEETASSEECAALSLAPGAKVMRMARVRFFEQQPMMVDRLVLPSERFPNFEALYRERGRTNFYSMLEQEYGVLVVKAEEQLRARAATKVEADLLRLSPDAPVLTVDRVSFTIDGTPIELRQIVMETSRQHYVTRSP